MFEWPDAKELRSNLTDEVVVTDNYNHPKDEHLEIYQFLKTCGTITLMEPTLLKSNQPHFAGHLTYTFRSFSG